MSATLYRLPGNDLDSHIPESPAQGRLEVMHLALWR